uniref:Uncharacterized protein n=1 Tax=Anguilla anguilla TaxID=7936 RepID=A0A0E9WF75_ANGAN
MHVTFYSQHARNGHKQNIDLQPRWVNF